MSDSKEPKSPEEVQKEIQSFLKDRFGTDVFSMPFGGAPNMAAQAQGEEQPPAPEPTIPEDVLQFRMLPQEVKAHLDRYVIGQDDAKRTLAVAVCDHYNHVRRVSSGESQLAVSNEAVSEQPSRPVEYVKQNVILLGPTGVGKTYLIRTLAHLIGVPFVKADSTKFSETGYVGGDVEDMVRELHRSAGGNASLAEHGIIFLDEVDKIASAENSSGGRDPSGRGVQVALLKLMEETEVPLRNPMDISSQFQDMMQGGGGGRGKQSINTRHVLFVVSGAFSGLEEIIEKRMTEGSIGFGSMQRGSEASKVHLMGHAATQDFVDYGFEPEFIGRLPIRCALNPLSPDELLEILQYSEGSILHQYRESFRGYDLDVAFDREALLEIARLAFLEKTGARGLMTVLESRLRDFKFHLPGTDVKRFAVTLDLVRDPTNVLQGLLAEPDSGSDDYQRASVEEWEDLFARRSGVRLRLDEESIAMAASISAQVETSITDHLDATFAERRDFLRKILEQSGRTELPVTPLILSRPSEGAELWLAP